jgi:Uma2 family endonuclease
MVIEPQGKPEGDFPTMSPMAYLSWEAEQEFKHEYENGRIIAMTGGTIAHSQISANFAAILIPHLRGKGCKVAVSDAKLSLQSGKYYYPDVMVSCEQRDRLERDFWQHPCLVVEVLSPHTEARDRGIKQQHYMLLDTLQTYMLISSEQARVEIYERGDRTWEYVSVAIEGMDFATDNPLIEISSIDLQFPLSFLYENVDFINSEENSS